MQQRRRRLIVNSNRFKDRSAQRRPSGGQFPRTRSPRAPSTAELTSESGLELEDPLEEDKDSPVPSLTHRYPDRVLMVTTHVSTLHRRFCARG